MTAVTIGNFDGVHRGHQELCRRVEVLAREPRWQTVALTFDPHPMKIVAPARAPRLLTTLPERVRLLEAQGIERVLVLPFTADLANYPPEEFAQRILRDMLQSRAVVVGENFRFGARQAGTTATLIEFGRAMGFAVEVVPPVRYRGETVSSSTVREQLAAGNVSHVGRLLRRCYAVEGEVVKGFGIGTRQTVPTLNVQPENETLPRHGVYVTATYDVESQRHWESITNVGVRPTFAGEDVTVETYLLSPFEGEAPTRLRIEFRRWIRAEQKFASPADLKAQILRDVSRAQAYWHRARLLY